MGNGVLLIRQHDQANSIEQALAARNQPIFRQAVIESEPLELGKAELEKKLKRNWDGIIAVSPAAVEFFHQQISQHGLDWPVAPYFCVGAGTAERLVQHSHQPVIYPAPEHTGEALLALPELQNTEGQKWLNITGADGRPLIAKTLKDRGADLTTLEVYQRHAVHPDLSKETEQWQQHVGVIVVTSAEQLKLFWEDLPESAHAWARDCTWVVSSQRLQKTLTDYNVKDSKIVVAQNATSEALLKAIPELSEKTMTSAEATKHEPEQKKPKRNWFTGFLIFLLILSVLVLAAGGYWLWQLQQEVDQTTAAKLERISEQLEETSRSQEQLNQRLADTSQTQRELQQRYRETEQRLADATQNREELEQTLFEEMQAQVSTRFEQLRQQHEAQAEEERRQAARERQEIRNEMSDTRASIASLQESVDRANLRVSADISLLEARNVAASASRKVRFEHDRDSAVRLLRHALELLQDTRSDTTAPIINQLRLDIELLEDLPRLDTEGLALQLSSLRTRVRELPLDRDMYAAEEALEEDAVTSNFADWRSNLSRAWDSFTEDFVRVQRSEEVPEMKLGAEQRALLKTQLDLQLQLAQQAVMQRQSMNFEHALDQAIEWVESYYSADRDEVSGLLEQLRHLRQHDIEPQLPTRLLSEVMLNDLVEELYGESE